MTPGASGRMRVVVLCFGLILTFGCTSFLKPEVGAVARKEARILLTDDSNTGTQQTRDLLVVYTLSQKGEECNFVGNVVFDRSIRDSFPIITSFFFYLSFLDGEGKVLETVDISPVIPTFGNIPDSLSLKMSRVRPPGSKEFVLHYSGGFRANPLHEGGEWSIYHFPFN